MIDAFVARYEARQQTALAGVSRAEARTDYRLLQMWDLLSLSLCLTDPKPTIVGAAPTSYDDAEGEGAMIAMEPLGDDTIKLDPYPFDAKRLKLGFVQRHLATRDYPTVEAFRLAYFSAAPILREFTFI